MKKYLIIAAGALALSTTACGRMADLEAPMPRQTERSTHSSRSLPDPATLNRPSSVIGIDGGPSNPIGASAAQTGPR